MFRQLARFFVGCVMGVMLAAVAAGANSEAEQAHSQSFDHNQRSDALGFGRDEWPIFHFDLERSSYNPEERILSRHTVDHLRLAWTFNTRFIADSSAVVADGIAYFGSDSGYLFAVNVRTGGKLWSAPNGTSENATPAVTDYAVYAVGANALRARDRFTGALLWESPIAKGRFSLSSPVVVSDRHSRKGRRPNRDSDAVVYLGGSDGLYAFDARTGLQLWKFATPAGVTSSPAVDDGAVYISTGTTVYAVDEETHTARWTYNTGGTTGVAQPSLAVGDGIVYLPNAGTLHAIDQETGTVLWTKTNPGFRASSPAVAYGRVYLGATTDHRLYAFDARTGAELWSFETEANIAYSSPTVANGVVYTGSYDGRIYALMRRPVRSSGRSRPAASSRARPPSSTACCSSRRTTI